VPGEPGHVAEQRGEPLHPAVDGDEIIPQVTDRYTITDHPERWAICGSCSGGNCAFTAAWLRRDRFRRVICFNSSFTQIPGGNRTRTSSLR
jgi:enterochelin esterase-like enzyme